jgi:DNA modification methylase
MGGIFKSIVSIETIPGIIDSMAINRLPLDSFFEAVHSTARISGLTHNFYKYPARFSPIVAREAIKAFTNPGDIVLDPFIGGGTTLVEASYLGRKGVGIDINQLATFISLVKTTPLDKSEISYITIGASF